MDNSNPFGFTNYNTSDFSFENNLQDIASRFNASDSPYARKLADVGLGFREKMILAKQANLGKLAAMEGYRTGYILGADDERAGVDPDSGLVQDEATGDIFRFRMRQAGNYDAVDNADVVAKSRYKQGYQPEYVAAMNGKRVEELTDFDYKNVKNYQTQETFAAWQDPDHQTIPYDPNFVYSAPSADQRIPVLYKSTGSGFYGRDLTDMINPKTGRSMTFDAAMNPYLNASFQLGDYLDTDANRRRIDEFNALPAQPMKDRVAQKRVDNIFNQPSNGRYPRTFESKKMSMDEIIDRYQADRNDFMEFVDQLGYNVDKAQASLKQTIGHLARALLPSSWIDENYWKSLDKPVNEQGMTLADVISGVDPIQYAIHQRHNKENDAVWDKAKGEYEKGNYGMAAVNALNYLRKSIVDVNYLLADSFGQMAASSGGTAAGGAVGGVIGGMVGGPAGAKVGAHIGAFLTGTMITAFDETVMARDQYKEQNNGQDMSPERVLATFGAHMLAAAPEQVLQMIGLKKVLPNGIANAIFKDGEKIASRASASIPELMSAKGALEAGKQVGKAFLGAGLAEAGQEGFQNFVTAYASQNQEKPKSAWEVAIDDDQLKAAFAGFAMGGVMHGSATGIGLGKSLRTEKANALVQEQFEEERQTKTIGGGTANTEQSNKLINDVQNIDLSASSSSADTLKVRDDLKKQQENLFINGAAEEALFKKISEAEVKSVTQMRKEGKSEEQITKALNGKTKEEVFTDIVLSSNYNSNWAITHNTDPTKVNRKDLTNELLSIAKDLGLTEEQARKTMKDVSSDVRYGPAGYLSYMAKARKGLEELKKPNLTDDEKKNLRNVTGNTILRLIHLLANQQNKLAAFAEGLEKIDAGDATDYTIKYPLSEGEFKIYGNYVLRDDPSSNKGVYGVINDIYDTVDEMTTFFKSEPNLSKDTSTALFAMYRNGQGSLPIDLNINENLRKRIYNAVDRIKARGPEDLKPVKPVTKENTSTYLRALGDVVRNLQNNRVDSDSHIKRLRTLDKLLRQDNNAYDALKTAIERHPKYTDQQKTDYLAQLNAIKSSIDKNRKNMSAMKADYTSTVAEAEKALNELNDDFINQHIFSKDGDYHSLGAANVPLTEARTRISNILQNIRATSGNTEMDRDLVNKLSTAVNKIQKRISDNIDTYNNRKKPTETTASKPATKSKFDREDLIPYNPKSLSRTDIAEIKKQASFGEISQYRSRMVNLLNEKLKSFNNTPSDKIPESTKRYVNSLRAKIDLLDQLAAILTKNRRQRLTSKIDTAKYRKLITSDVDHILKYESNDDKQAFDIFANLENLKASAEAKLEKAKKSQAKDAKQAIQTAEARLELIEKRIKELEALPQMRRVEVDANGVIVNDVRYGEYTFLKSDFNEAHKELDKILGSYKLDATNTKASAASTKTSSQAKPSKGQTRIIGQMSESAKKAFNALFNAGKIDKLKEWEAYYVREKDKYKPGTQEYADVMQTKAYITKLINELTKPQKSSKPAEKPAEAASSETAQKTPENASESPQTKGNGQDDESQGEAQQTPPTTSETPSEGSQENAVGKAGEGYVLHSGGADGSDIAWSTIAKDLNLNITSNHYYIGKKGSKNAPNGNIKLDASFINEAMPHIQGAAKVIGKNVPTSSFVKQLIARNWMQVKGSDGIFAISNGWFKNRVQEVVDGGTGWAVQMAINEAEKAEEQETGSSKPIYVFDTPTNTWYKFNVSNYTANITGRWFEPIDYIPTLTKNFAGIGSRFEKNGYKLPDNAKKAIEAVYKTTFNKTEEISSSEQNQPSQPDAQISRQDAPRIDQTAQDGKTPTETQEVPQKGAERPKSGSEEVPWKTDDKPEEKLVTAETPETLLSGEPNPEHPKYKNNLKLYRQDLKKWSSAQMEERPADEADIAVDEGTPVGEPDFLDNTESEPEPITDAFETSENFEEPAAKPRTVKKYVNGKLVESRLEDKKPTSKPRKVTPLTLNVSDEVNNEISTAMQEGGFLPSDKSLNEFLDSLTEEQKADALKFKTERATQHREHSATRTFAKNSFELDTILYALYNINTDFKLPDLTTAYKFVHNFAVNEFKKDPKNFSKATLTDKAYLSTLGDYATAEQFKDSAADKNKPLETVFLLKGEKEVKDANGNTVTVKVNESAELINNVPGNTRGERQKYKEQSGDVGAIVTDKGKKLTWLNQQVVATDRADSWIPKLLNDYLPHMEATRAWYEAVKPVDEKASQWLNPTHGREVKNDENLASKVAQLRSRLDNSPHARLLYNMILSDDGETIHFEYNDITLACVDFSIKEFIASSQFNKFMHPNTLDDNAVAAIFHLSPDNTLPGDIYALKHILVHEGLPKSLLASSIGQLIMRNLGLKANTAYGYDTVYAQMAAGLGAYAVDVLISQRFFEENTYNNIDEDGSKKVNVLKANELNLIKPAKGLSSKVNSITDQYLGFKTNNKSKVRLSNGLNRFKNTENNYSTDPVFNKPIPVDDEAPYYVRNTQEQLTISEKQRKTLKKCQEQAWEIDDDIAQFIIENMNAVMQKEGLIDEQTDSTSWNDLSFEAKIGAQGVNDSIRRRLEAFKTYYLMQKEFKDSGTFNGIYFKYFIGKNGRGYLDSSEFNPQVDKLLRHICLPKDARVDIKVNNTGDFLLCENFAIAQAFDALGNRNDVKNFAEYMKNLSDDALIEIRKELTARSNDSFKKWFAENHPDTISVGVESYSQCLNVIQHLLRRNKAKANNQSSFTTSLSVENDSTTSGYAIKFLNMPFTSVSSFLEKVGILNYVRKAQLEGKIVLSNNEEKDLLFTMEELKNVKGFDDIYRTSARKTADEVMSLVNGDTKALQEKFSDKIRQNIANKLARKHKISVEELNNDPKLKDELERKVLAESEYLVNVFKVMKDALPTAKNGKIDSYFRTLMKRPTMVFGYSATARTISQRVVYELMGDFIETYLQIKNRNGIENYLAEVKGVKEGDKGYEDAKKKAEAIYKTMEMIKTKDNAKLDDKLKKTFVEKIKVKRGDTVVKLNTLFENLIGVTYGDITGEILEKQFASYLQVNNDMIWMSKQMFDWYKSIYNKRVNALRNAHPKGYVTYAQMKQVHKDLLEEGIVPYTTLASNNLNPDDAKLLLYGNTKEVDNFTSVQNYINVNGVNTDSTTVYADIRIPDSPGRSGAVIPIHGQDGDVVMQVLNEYRDSKYNYGMNIIHDAIVMSAFHQIPITRRYSELMFELNKKHDIFTTMLQNFDRVLNAFARETKIPKEQILRTAIISDRGTPVSTSEQNVHADKVNKNGNEHILMEGSTQAYYRGQLQEFEDDVITVGSLLENAKAWERVIFDARKAFYNEPHFGVNMGGVNGVGVIYEAKDPISQDFKSVIEQDSSYKGFKTVEDITLLKSQALTDVEARVTILDDLQNLAATTNNTLCSDEHMNHLKEFIRAANPENVQNILFELVDNGLFNTGQYIVSKTGSKTIRVALDAKSNIDPITKLAVESYLMAPAEIYAHEITHAALDPVFAHAHDLGIEKEMKTAQMIYEEASKLLTVDDLMPEAGTFNENLTNRYRQHIQKTLDYIFNNPDHKNNRGLKEFCAYFNTCEKFRDALKKKLTEKYKDEVKATKFIDKLIAIVKNFLDMFFGKDNFTKMFNKTYRTVNGVDKVKVQNLFDQMDLLLHKWSQANEKASQRLLEHPRRGIENMFRFFSQMIQKYNAPLGEWLRKHTIELADTKGWFNIHPKLMKLGATSWDKFKLYSLVAACYPISAKHRAAWRRLMNGVFKVSQDSLIRSIARDMTKPDYNSSLLEMLALRTNIVDTAAKNIESVTRDQLKEDFGRELKEKEEYSLTQCILRTDAQCLNDIDYFLHLNADNEYLQTEIENVKTQLKDFYPKNYAYNWVCGQALGLARFMVTGKGHEQLNTNAYGIATGLYYTTEVTENADIQYDPKAEQLIDKLATLYAIEHTSQEDKDVLNTLPRKGLENFINTHKKFVEESKYGVVLDDENIDNKTRIIDPIHVIKGYTKSLINSDYETEINLIDPQTQREMAKQGYKLIYTINPDNVTQRAMSLGFYKRFGIPKRRDGGAVSLQGYHAIGTTLESMSYADINPNEANYKVLRDKLHTLWKDNADKISKVINKRLKSSPMTFEEFDRFSTNFSPIASTSSKGDAIADYRITMSHDHKRQALGMDERGITILSKMYASINRKAQSSIANNEVLNFLINDMQENMNVLDRYDKKGRGYKYILLDELTDDQYLKDAWRVLPKEIRDYTKKHTLYVREDWLPSLFGVSNMSLNDTRLIRKIPFGFIKRAIAIGEMIMKTIAYYRKQSIVLKIPAVLIGNIISNLMYSIANHQNPLKVLKLTIANGKAIREYLNTKKELNRIIMKQRLGTATATELVSKNMLKSKLEANRVHPLMEKGMYQAIVEDMNPEELESTSKLTKLLKYNKLMDKVPGSIKSVINHIYLGRGTPIYEFMYTATQYSDFMARCTEYQLRMEKAKSEYERIQKAPVTKENEAFKNMNYDQFLKNYEKITSIRVLNAFINYDKPQSKFEQYLNDMGLLFFTKFAKRIQHVITDQLWTNPIGALMFIIGQHLFVDTEDIFEQNLFSKKWSALVNTPWENFIGAAIPMPIQFLTGQQKAF